MQNTIRLIDILKHSLRESTENNILTSKPKPESVKKFRDVTEQLKKVLKNPKTVNKSVMYNNETDANSSNMLKPSLIMRGEMLQEIGEYEGDNFKGFTEKIAQIYEKAGFTVEVGYGSDDIKGFEVKEQDGEVVGEVDFLQKDSIPNFGDTVIIKIKK